MSFEVSLSLSRSEPDRDFPLCGTRSVFSTISTMRIRTCQNSGRMRKMAKVGMITYARIPFGEDFRAF